MARTRKPNPAKLTSATEIPAIVEKVGTAGPGASQVILIDLATSSVKLTTDRIRRLARTQGLHALSVKVQPESTAKVAWLLVSNTGTPAQAWPSKKAPAKPAAKKAPAKKAPAKKAPATKPAPASSKVARKAPARKAPAKKA